MEEPTGFHIRLPPPSGRRGGYLRLLSRVDPDAQNGFGFHGRILRRRLVSRAELRPGAEYPERPVLLEYAVGGLHVIWRMGENGWSELARATSNAWEWVLDLRPAAVRALAEARGEAARAPDLAAHAARISEFVEAELAPLDTRDRYRLLAIVSDQVAARLSA